MVPLVASLLVAIGVTALMGVLMLDSDVQLAVAWYRLTEGGTGEEQSDLTRLELYRDAWAAFAAEPFVGTGFASIGRAHNIYLQVLQSTGVLGMVALLIYFVAPILRARKYLVTYRPNILALGIACSIAVFLAIGLVQNIIYVRAALIPIAFLWALGRRPPIVELSDSLSRILSRPNSELSYLA
jgi:O-antigen ligase